MRFLAKRKIRVMRRDCAAFFLAIGWRWLDVERVFATVPLRVCRLPRCFLRSGDRGTNIEDSLSQKRSRASVQRTERFVCAAFWLGWRLVGGAGCAVALGDGQLNGLSESSHTVVRLLRKDSLAPTTPSASAFLAVQRARDTAHDSDASTADDCAFLTVLRPLVNSFRYLGVCPYGRILWNST